MSLLSRFLRPPKKTVEETVEDPIEHDERIQREMEKLEKLAAESRQRDLIERERQEEIEARVPHRISMAEELIRDSTRRRCYRKPRAYEIANAANRSGLRLFSDRYVTTQDVIDWQNEEAEKYMSK